MDKEQLQELYLREGYYWGKEPNSLARRILDFVPEEQRQGRRLADLGAGEGRDSVFLAKEGFNVLAVDLAPAGLAKAKLLAEEMDTQVSTLAADINDVVLPEQFDVICSIGSLQYILPENRERQFRHFKSQTSPGGLHVFFAFTQYPEVDIAPDWGKNEYLYQRDELQGYYHDWEVIECQETIFACNSGGIPHQHAATIIIARKPV